MCLALLYGHRPWEELRHYGRQGSDDGVDIFAIENLEDGTRRTWAVQCKRYQRASKADLTRAVDAALAKNPVPPAVFLLIVSCDVSKTAHEGFEQHARESGIGLPLIWTQSVLEAKLFCERKDLLFSFFGISTAGESRAKESRVRLNMALKKRIKKELLTRQVDPSQFLKRPNQRFCASEAIIHSVDDDEYPYANIKSGAGIHSWFKLEFWDTYFNGVEFILGIKYVAIRRDDRWSFVDHDSEFDSRFIVKKKAWHIGRIPFRNIVEIDPDGDEFYPFPHFYCRFEDEGEPYEEHLYRLIEQDHYTFDPDLLMPAVDLVNSPIVENDDA